MRIFYYKFFWNNQLLLKIKRHVKVSEHFELFMVCKNIMIPGIDNFQIKNERDIILSKSSFFCWIYLKRKMSKFVIHERLADWRFRLFSVRATIVHFCWGFFKRFLAQFLMIEIFLQFFLPIRFEFARKISKSFLE